MKTFVHDRSENPTDRRILRADGERAFGKRVIAAALVEQMLADQEDFVEMYGDDCDRLDDHYLDMFDDGYIDPMDDERDTDPMDEDPFDDYEPDDYGYDFDGFEPDAWMMP